MSTDFLPIRYRDFYDVPRAILVEHGGELYYFDCPFSEALDDYAEEYQVYRLAAAARGVLEAPSWEGLPGAAIHVGSVAVAAVEFDSTRRRAIAARVFERLGPL